MVEAAGVDVVRPAVAADDPHAAPHEVIRNAAQVGGGGPVQVLEPPFHLGNTLALRTQLRLAELRRGENVVHQFGAEIGRASCRERV